MKLQINREEWMKNILPNFPKGKGVEVGCFAGEFSRHILSNWNGTLYMVDVWKALGEEYDDGSNMANIPTDMYKEAMKNTDEFEERAVMIRTTSLTASEIFENGSLDFVYIDANHAYSFVKDDINAWYKKVKTGGWLCGHDYLALDWWNDPNFAPNRKDKYIYSSSGGYMGLFGVNPAVDEFCQEYGYKISLTNEWLGTWMIKL